MAVHKWRCLFGRFVEELQDLPSQLRHVSIGKKCRSMWYIAGRTGLHDRPREKISKVEIGRVLCSCYGGFTQNYFQAPTRQISWHPRLAGWNTANRKRENKSCSRILRSCLKVCCWFKNKICNYKIDNNKVHFLVLLFDQKSSLLGFVAKWTVYWSRNKESSNRFEVVIGVKQTSWRYEHNLMALWLKLGKQQILKK